MARKKRISGNSGLTRDHTKPALQNVFAVVRSEWPITIPNFNFPADVVSWRLSDGRLAVSDYFSRLYGVSTVRS